MKSAIDKMVEEIDNYFTNIVEASELNDADYFELVQKIHQRFSSYLKESINFPEIKR